MLQIVIGSTYGFNPRTYIRYDSFYFLYSTVKHSFNPRTYIRYDCPPVTSLVTSDVSIHVPI